MKGGPAPAPPHATACAALEAAADHPCGVTFVDLREREIRLSWSEVHSRGRRAAGVLRSLGIRPGDRVAIVLRTEAAFLDAFFGSLLAGAVPVPLYPPVRLGRMEEYLAATARMVVTAGARLVVAGGVARRLIGEALARSRPELGCLPAEALLSGPEVASPGSSGEDLALVQFSSGSTVDPKPVALTHASLMAQVGALMAVVRPTPRDCMVSWLPLYHDMGLIGCLLGALSHPGPLVLIPPEHFLARPALWLRTIGRHRGTISAGPHFAYAYAAARVRDEDLAGVDLSCWRIAMDGAEPVTAGALRRFAQRFAPFGFDPASLVPCYGLAEAALAVTVAPRGAPLTERVDPVRLATGGEVVPGEREIVSVGPPVPGVELEIRDERGQPLPDRRLGRVHVRGPSLMRGYLGDEAATLRVLRGGWLDTGDLGFTARGALFVHGRAKDAVVIRGANRAPDEFEACLEGIAGLRPGCAVAAGFVPDGSDQEELLLLVERARAAGPPAVEAPRLAEMVRRAVLERTGVRAWKVELLAPGTLPRTSSGKMRRGEALRRFLAGTLLPPRRVTGLGLVRELARSALAQARAGRRPAP